MRMLYVWVTKYRLAFINRRYQICWKLFGAYHSNTIYWKRRWLLTAEEAITSLEDWGKDVP
jgi:hypothetical protein